jgi:hypothetical protein
MRKLLLVLSLAFLFIANTNAQTTVVGTTTGSVYGSATGGSIVFAIRNNNANPILITNLGSPTENPYTATYTLWYKATPLTGAPGAISAANGWIQIGGPYTVPAAQPTGITEMFPGLNFQIPAGTAYRFAILGTGDRSPYYATANSSANIYSGGGIDIISQDNPFSPGYGGTTSTPTNTPRGFYGSITFQAVDACTSPTAGQVTVLPSLVCQGSPITLSVSGNSFATGNTYTWQSSTTAGGPWTIVGTSTTTNSLTLVPPATAYYRLSTSCNSGTPANTAPVLVTVGSILPANTYTIDNTFPTSGLNFNSFTDAFNAMACGITGKVIFNVKAGQVFNETPPELSATGTLTDSIIFRKSGVGANPLIMPAVPGTIAASTTIGTHGDGVININGGDYITFDAIDINASNFSAGVDGYEYGYYLKKKSATDACKNVTIKNSVITLVKGIYSFGIHVSNNSGTNTNITIPGTSGISENIKISGNTISGAYGGIYVRGYADATLYDQNIAIGVDSANTVTDFGGGASIGYGIYAISQTNLKIANNKVSSVTSGHTTTLYGIYTGTATNANTDIYNNTVTVTGGGTTTSIYGISNNAGSTGTNNLIKIYNNTITNCAYPTATSGDLYLIDQGATAYNVEIYGNTLTNNTASPSTTGSLTMINQSAAVINQAKIYNNLISGNTKTSGTTGVSYCIFTTGAATANNQVYNNTIENISVTSTTGSITGIHLVTAATNTVYKNKISGLTNTATTTGPVYGITLATGGLTNNVYNNMISDLNAPTSTTTGTTTTDLIRGINITSTTALSTQNVSFNTILLNASGGAIFSTSGVFHTTSATATTSTLNLRNNIIVNKSSPNGVGFASAYRRSSANVLGNYGTASNNNLFYVNGGGNSIIYYDGTNFDADLNAFKTRVASRETASISEDPNFVNGSAPYDLHINPAVPTQIESGAVAIAGITDDFDGNARNATTPDLGADEFTGVSADLTGPIVTYTPLGTKTICTSTKTITATITDASGINITAGRKPRLWFKKATENDALPATNTSASNGWKYVETSSTTSPFTFTFNFSLLTSAVTGGDSISYFIAAQDLASTPNVGVSAATFNSPPATVALSAATFPVSGNINGFAVLSLQPIVIKASSYDVCASGKVILNVDGVDVSGGEYQWQSSPHNKNTWTDVPGLTTVPATTATLTDSADFRLVVKCGGTAVGTSPSNVISVNVNNPHLASSTGATRCGSGTVNLTASAPGFVVNWYANATTTTPLYTGNTFTTPVINNNTTFYAAASTAAGGPAVVAVGAGATTSATYSNPFYSLWSNTHTQHIIPASELNAAGINAGTLTSVALNITAAGTLPMIDLSLKIGTTSATDMTAFVTTPLTTVFTSASYMPVTGINTLTFTTPFTWDGSSNIILEFCHGNAGSTATMSRTALVDATSYVSSIKTHTSAATAATVQCPNTTTNVLTYSVRPQFTFGYEPGCVGSRVPVVATITTPPALTTSGSKTICSNAIDSIQVTSGAASFNTFVWSPTTNLYTDAAGTIPYSGTNVQKVYVRGGTGKTGYTITATNSTTSCANIITDTIYILPVATLTASKSELCVSGTTILSLDPATGYGNGSFTWQSSADGINYTTIAAASNATYTTPTITATTYYKVLVKNSTGATCNQPSTMITVNSPTLTVINGKSCGTGTVQLSANSAGDIKWYAAATGGVPLSTGNLFTTPVITATTTYYASATLGGGGVQSVGPVTSPATDGYTGLAGLNFDALTPFTITGVYVYPLGTGTGDVVFALQDAAQANVQQVTVNLTGTATPGVKTFVPLNFSVPAGTGLSLMMLSRSGGVASLKRDLSATTVGGFPQTVPGVVSITQGRLGAGGNATVWYFFYDWQITTGCESARVPVTATIDNTPGCTMPVTLLNFSGEKRGGLNRLSWSTATEINNAGFELQRSIDGVTFSKLAYVTTKAINGNSSGVINYNFDDAAPLRGFNYYRLKQVDKDGKATLTNIVLIKGDKTNTVQVIAVYPNPVKDVLNMKLEAPQGQKVTIVITDAVGKVIMQQQGQLVVGDNKLQVPTSRLAQGTYFVKVTCADGCETAVHKFMKE